VPLTTNVQQDLQGQKARRATMALTESTAFQAFPDRMLRTFLPNIKTAELASTVHKDFQARQVRLAAQDRVD